VKKLKGRIPRLDKLVEIFKALGDETRCRIVYLLSEDELCVCDIAAILESSSSLVSHHLRILRHLRLVKCRKEGKRAFYSLDDIHILNLITQALEHVSE
jgi:DNA-binding transcriptional ArsR family regulator